MKGNLNAITGRDYQLDCAMFEAQKFRMRGRLDTLEKAVDHESPDTTLDSSLDTSIGSSVFSEAAEDD